MSSAVLCSRTAAAAAPPRAAIKIAAAAAVAAAVLLALFYFLYVPMSPDGGWYAYPSYAWANGGDPSENMQGFDAVAHAGNRVVAMFGWENRSNLTVPAMGVWFKLVPASAASIALLGVLQWLVISVLAGTIVLRVTRDGLLAALAAIVTFADSRLIAEAVSDARPDVPVLLVALALLWALAAIMQGGGVLARAAAFALAVMLPLVHVTSANAIAALSAFAGLWALLAWREGARRSTLVSILLPAAVMCAVFLLRQPILDGLVPTIVPREIEAAGQHSLVQKLKEIVAAGLSHKLAMEAGRWTHQFHVANFVQLAAVLAGVAVAVRFGGRLIADAGARVGICLAVGLAAGMLVMFAADPHHTPGHALVLAVIGYCATAIVVARAVAFGLIAPSRMACVAVHGLAALAALKAVHTGIVHWKYARQGISTAALREQVAAALPAQGPVRIEGASEIWPYLTGLGRHVEISDPDRYVLAQRGDARPEQGASLLVIGDDHYKAGWGRVVEDWQTAGLIAPLGRIGDCRHTARCFEIYRIVPR